MIRLPFGVRPAGCVVTSLTRGVASAALNSIWMVVRAPSSSPHFKHTKAPNGKQVGSGPHRGDNQRRKSSFGLAILAIFLFPPFVLAESPVSPSDTAIPAATYRAACRDIADRMLSDVFTDPVDWVARQRKFAAISHAALAQARLWRWTHNTAYADGANRFLLAVAQQQNTIREADFFTVYPFAKAFQILRDNNQLEPRVRRAAVDFFHKRYRARDVADHNQALTRACGLALAAKLLPEDPSAPQWRGYALDVWQYCLKMGDITENASNYNRIDAVYLFLLAELLERESELRTPSFLAMYRRWRDQVSPAGAIPAYGDSGMGPLTPQPDWPRLNAWGEWVAAFERAADFYDDPTFRWAAQRIFRRGMKSEPLGRRYFHIEALTALMCAGEWAPAVVDGRPLPAPAPGPMLQTRRDESNAHAWDKLILNPSRSPGAPYVLCDLYPRGHHAHTNQHGGIEWFESGNVPLVANLGYNNREPHHTNAFVIHPRDGRGFPHRTPFAANQWQTAELPTDRMPAPLSQPHLRTFKDFALRVDSPRGVTVWVDNLRLAGPKGGSQTPRLLESFESPEGWNFAPHPTGMSRQGDFALVWQFPPGAQTTYHPEVRKRLTQFVFDPERYPRLLLDWKVSDNSEQARPLIVRTGVDFHAHTLQLHPHLSAAHVQSTASGDQLGTMAFQNWFASGVRHERQMALTREGVLVVVDRVWPTPEVIGRWAGPVWHVGSRRVAVANAQPNKNWFDIRGAAKGLLLVMSRPSAAVREFGIQEVDAWSLKGQKTVFARQELKDKAEAFVSVLIPHEAKDKRQLDGKRVALYGDMQRAEVQIPADFGPPEMTIVVSRAGQLKVDRRP